MRTFDHPGIAKVAAALAEAGLPRSVDEIRVLDEDVRTAAQAAAAVDAEVGAIANSLLFRVTTPDGDAPLLVLTSGAHRAQTGVLAELVGVDDSAVRMADPDFVRAHTGQVIGGVAPLGHPEPVRTAVDRALRHHPVVWAAAGHPKAVFPTTFAELLTITGGTGAVVAREPSADAPETVREGDRSR